MPPEKRYWAYKHDADGELIDDFGDFETLEEAIDVAIDEGLSEDGYDKTVRVVDKQNDSTTVWIAGPGNQITQVESLHPDDPFLYSKLLKRQ